MIRALFARRQHQVNNIALREMAAKQHYGKIIIWKFHTTIFVVRIAFLQEFFFSASHCF